nr:unnamed protein product [Digitaria exilis]
MRPPTRGTRRTRGSLDGRLRPPVANTERSEGKRVCLSMMLEEADGATAAEMSSARTRSPRAAVDRNSTEDMTPAGKERSSAGMRETPPVAEERSQAGDAAELEPHLPLAVC